MNTRKAGLEEGIAHAQKVIDDLQPVIKVRRLEKNFVRANELIAMQQGARMVRNALKAELALIPE